MLSIRILKSLALVWKITQASHVRDSDDENGSQFLGFNGTVSAIVNYPAEFQDTCKSPRTLGPYVNSYLYVGINPPWDTNPFFFELYHRASESYTPLIGGITEDEVYNLDFASSAYACWRNSGKPCSFYETQWHYRPEILLDLTKANVKKASNSEGEESYEVTGNEQSYIKNETERATTNGVDVANGCYSQQGFSWDNGLVWNDTISWTYSLTFSNNTASAFIKTTIGENTMEIIYTGERMTNITESLVPEIELVLDDETKPGFRYSNDSQIFFRNTTSGWRASPNEIQETSTSGTRTATSTRTTSQSTSDAGLTATQPSGTGVASHLSAGDGSVLSLLIIGIMFVFRLA